MTSFSKFIQLLRIHNWYYLMGIPLLAILKYPRALTPLSLLLVLSFASIYFCWGYVFNNLYDQEEDHPQRNPFRSMTPGYPMIIMTFLLTLLLVFASLSDLILETLILVAINALYSVPPIRLKRHLWPTLFANGVFFSFPYYAAIKTLNGGLSSEDLKFTAFIFLLFLPIQYVHHLEHREERGLSNRLRQRLTAVSFFAVLCLATALSNSDSSQHLTFATVVYSLICASVLFKVESAGQMRVGVRRASLLFGACLVGLLAWPHTQNMTPHDLQGSRVLTSSPSERFNALTH